MRGKRESDTESEREREEENGCEKVERTARKRTVIKKDRERKGIITKRRIYRTNLGNFKLETCSGVTETGTLPI